MARASQAEWKRQVRRAAGIPEMPSKNRSQVATHCMRGHAFDAENTRVTIRGNRICIACQRMRDAARPRRERVPRNQYIANPKTPEQRFHESYAVSESGCWQWQRVIRNPTKGYGQMWVNGRKVQAHRFAYELLVGPIPEGLTIDHLCRNEGCVNPAHLEPVTAAENTRRAHASSNNS